MGNFVNLMLLRAVDETMCSSLIDYICYYENIIIDAISDLLLCALMKIDYFISSTK